MKAIFDKTVWMLMQLPYRPITLNRKRFGNARCAKNTINLIKRLNINPASLVDIGCNESQWTYWLRKEFPNMMIHSFDPLDTGKAIGYFHKFGLSDKNETTPFRFCDTNSDFDPDSPCSIVGRRFDSIRLELPDPRILKVDAQGMTVKALLGFGNILQTFSVVVIEIDDEFAFEIYSIMSRSGFTHSTTVDSGYWRGLCSHHDVAFYRTNQIQPVTQLGAQPGQ